MSSTRWKIGARQQHAPGDREAVARAAAFDHVTSKRERAAGETDQRHRCTPLLVNARLHSATASNTYCSLTMSGTASAFTAASSRSGMGEPGPFANTERSPRPIASGTVRMSENRIAASRS